MLLFCCFCSSTFRCWMISIKQRPFSYSWSFSSRPTLNCGGDCGTAEGWQQQTQQTVRKSKNGNEDQSNKKFPFINHDKTKEGEHQWYMVVRGEMMMAIIKLLVLSLLLLLLLWPSMLFLLLFLLVRLLQFLCCWCCCRRCCCCCCCRCCWCCYC